LRSDAYSADAGKAGIGGECLGMEAASACG
jgi:hypothetical protein